MQDKKSLRAIYRTLKAEPMALADRAERSERIISKLEEVLSLHSYRRIGAYMALSDEPELTPWLCRLTSHYEIYIPRVEGEDMHFYRFIEGDTLDTSGAFGIREPRLGLKHIAPTSLDLIIIPGITFDNAGYRLGRGKGYYDRYLPKTKEFTIGVSLGLMPIKELPRDPWDTPMQLVIQP